MTVEIDISPEGFVSVIQYRSQRLMIGAIIGFDPVSDFRHAKFSVVKGVVPAPMSRGSSHDRLRFWMSC